MTIKVRDLLKKLVNGEAVPKKIEYKGTIYKYFEDHEYLSTKYREDKNNGLCLDYIPSLEEEAEIIEEIEYPILHKISADKNTGDKMPNQEYLIDCNFAKLNKAIYKIIDELKELKRD